MIGREFEGAAGMNQATTRAPRHLWIVGTLAVLWNAVGAFDYTATKLRLESYMSQFTPEQLAYFYGIPLWAVATWAIAVWGALLGSVGLLLRRRWATWAFGASIVGMVLTGIHSFLLSDGLAVMGQEVLVFTAVIWVIAFALFFYARAMAGRGVLR
jgi:hypothetical protein